MDTRLIFRDYLDPIKTEGGTRLADSGAKWLQTGASGRLGQANPPSRPPGKSSKEGRGTRTTNRHRWTRRVFSGARVMDCSGTRQISTVTSGEGVPRATWVAVNSLRRLFNKNTGLCKVENDV
jgi:hypothetical protein